MKKLKKSHKNVAETYTKIKNKLNSHIHRANLLLYGAFLTNAPYSSKLAHT